MNDKDIPSLLNNNNHFYWNKRKFTKFSNLVEVGNELQAQIDLAVSMGINVSHIDSHEGALFFDPDIFKMYLNLAKKNDLLAFVPIQPTISNNPKVSIILFIYHLPICSTSFRGITWYAPLLYAGATVKFLDSSAFHEWSF